MPSKLIRYWSIDCCECNEVKGDIQQKYGSSNIWKLLPFDSKKTKFLKFAINNLKSMCN